ncbi:MAG TPA: molybdopterin molybdotransferase MoeA [Candidatus Methylacidiphilales bacterium]|jgi:molybdopterin molybdotransferase|nr:molybdopterin molybdotransferase MoeA [Candidatus Methylacidiphilales bacterium]
MNTSWHEVLRECLGLAKPGAPHRVQRKRSAGCVLAQDIRADRDYPEADLSMMDGYAVGAETRESYRVEGENTPGAGAGAALNAGTARRIFTGAELPSGATRVVPQELVRREGETVIIKEWPGTDFVRPRGREARSGDIVLKKGTRVGPVEMAVLATVGCTEVDVAQVRVQHLTTGDEIVSPDEPLPEGKIRNSNLDLIDAMLRQVGLLVGGRANSSDDRDTVFRCVDVLAHDCDCLLISGGASVGDHDHARPALEASGFKFLAHGLHVRPGRPVGIARRGEQWAFALPGNPLSHLVVLRLLVIPILRACCGETNVEPQLIRAVLDGELSKEVPRRDTFWPASITALDGQLRARPGRFLSSGDLIGTAGINGFVHLPVGKQVPGTGEPIDILPLSPTFP